MAGDYIQLAQLVKNNNIKVNLVAINVSTQPEKAEQMHLEDGYPSIRLYRGNNHYTEFGKEGYTLFKTYKKPDLLQYLKQNKVDIKNTK